MEGSGGIPDLKARTSREVWRLRTAREAQRQDKCRQHPDDDKESPSDKSREMPGSIS